MGKTTVIERALKQLESEGIVYLSINFGTFMFEMASREGIVTDRDQMRKLDPAAQKDLQRRAAVAISSIGGNVIVDTHCSIKTPQGFLPGLPEWVIEGVKPDTLILVETDEDQILGRRLQDPTRVRDMEGARSIMEHQLFNRAISAAIATKTGCTVKFIRNQDFLLDRAVDEMAAVLR